jgi:hypothetical protein
MNSALLGASTAISAGCRTRIGRRPDHFLCSRQPGAVENPSRQQFPPDGLPTARLRRSFETIKQKVSRPDGVHPRPLFRRQRPYRCTAANWRFGPIGDILEREGSAYADFRHAQRQSAGDHAHEDTVFAHKVMMKRSTNMRSRKADDGKTNQLVHHEKATG